MVQFVERENNFFIEETNHGIWKVVREWPFAPIDEVNGAVDKYEKDLCIEDKENVQRGLKSKNITTTALGLWPVTICVRLIII